jgi:hypothetical protein
MPNLATCTAYVAIDGETTGLAPVGTAPTFEAIAGTSSTG